jgi:PAS domain S-box-containing protein
MLKDLFDEIPDSIKLLLIMLTVLVCVAITLFANFIMGIDKVYTHIFYVPIILAGIWYNRKAVYVALALGLFYVAASSIVDGHVDIDSIFRFFTFLIVAFVVDYLAAARERSHRREIQTERAFRKVAKDLQLVLESTGEGIYTTDNDGRCNMANAAGARMLGYAPDELLGRNMHRLIHHTGANGTPSPEDGCCVALSRASGTGCRINDDVFWRKDGTSFPVAFSSYPIVEDDRTIGSVVVFTDITKRKQDEEARSRLAAIVETTEDAIIGKTLDGVITSWNAGAERVYGYTAREVIGRPVSMLAPPGYADEVPAILGEIRSEGHFKRIETRRLRKDGSAIYVSLTISPIFDSAGDIIGASTIARDITENKRVERELQEAKSQTEMYNDLLSHDINNLNQVGISFLELAMDDPAPAAETRGFMEKSLESLRNSSALIDNVRKLQKVRAPMAGLEPVDVCAMLDRVKSQCSGSDGRDVSIDITCDSCNKAMANDLLGDVFSNIVGNAIKHSEGAVAVDIRSDEVTMDNKKYCRVSFEDNGPGIPDEVKPKLFSRFQRGATRASGKGLGLYLVKKLVESYNGMVWVEDRVHGDHRLGARFVVMLPAGH